MKTLINPWKGLKRHSPRSASGADRGENPNKSLEGIKTYPHIIAPSNSRASENPNKSLEGIKTAADRRGLL